MTLVAATRSVRGGDSHRVGLPRSRTFRRQRSLRVWWVAVAIALLANLAVVIGLSQVSHLHQATIDPPLAVRTLRQHDPEPPPLPEQPRETAESVPDEAVPVALPSLDVPNIAPTAALSLPAISNLVADLSLAISVPAFTAIGAADTPPAAIGAAGPPAFDRPAERESAFDLDRYYPRSARLRGVEGTTRVRIAIGADGRVSGAQVLDSTPPGVFEDAAVRLARTIRYRPATAAGAPVSSVQDTTIAWTIRK